MRIIVDHSAVLQELNDIASRVPLNSRAALAARIRSSGLAAIGMRIGLERDESRCDAVVLQAKLYADAS